MSAKVRNRDFELNPLLVVKCKDRQAIATDCLKHRLYSPGGWMRNEYLGIRDGIKHPTRRRLLVLYVSKVPAAAIVGSKNCIMVYVAPTFRRSGFATFLINHYIRRFRLKRDELWAMTGLKGSGSLYFACGIRKAPSVIQFYRAFDWDFPAPQR